MFDTDELDIEGNDVDLDIARNEIFSFSASFSLAEYSKKLDNHVFYNPEFQRRYIWDEKRKSRFIESLLYDFPIPQIFLYKEPTAEKYMIIDGYQRISTINTFFNNKFTLSSVTEKLLGKKFEDLTENDQEMLRNKQLTATIVRQIQPKNESILYSLFDRLNTGGQNLNNMEVRRAVSFGPLIKALEKSNEDSNWRLIWGKKEVHERFLDVELILRVLAFSQTWDKQLEKLTDYQNLKGFLNSYCFKHRNEEQTAFFQLFAQITQNIITQLGENPFTLYQRPNYVLLDSVLTALLIKKQACTNLKEKFQKLKNDAEFKSIYEAKQGTMSAKSINTRIKLALDYLL